MDDKRTANEYRMDMDMSDERKDTYKRLQTLTLALQDTLNNLITLDKDENDARIKALWHATQCQDWLSICGDRALLQSTDAFTKALAIERNEQEGG